MDKDRGYVNGAVGIARQILSYTDGVPTVFTVELSTGVLVLVHPIYENRQCFLPCTYGYATTIRRAQGATYDHGCIWFDHRHPPERGYGYVAASRFKSKSGIYLFGKVRRTAWRPVRHGCDHDDQDYRGEESQTDYSSDEEEAWVASYPREDYRGDEDSGTDSDRDYRDDLDDADIELYQKLRGAEYDAADELFKPGRTPGSIGKGCDAIDK